jgi:hypothetical protein
MVAFCMGSPMCTECGAPHRDGVIQNCPSKRRTIGKPCGEPPQVAIDTSVRVGLGDRIEAALTGIGITKERYVAFKEQFGLPPTCNCDGRKSNINDAERYMREVVSNLGDAAANALAKIWAPVGWTGRAK